MARNINTLLKKKSWTGEEVGKVLIASMLNDIKNRGKNHKPLFTQSEFEKMEKSLSTERDYSVYKVYKVLYNAVLISYDIGQGQFQQFYNGYSRLLAVLKEIQHTENARKAIAQYPLIVTAEQYKRLETEARAKLSANRESLSSLVFNVLDDILNADSTTVPTEIADALEAAKREPAANRYYINLLNSTFERGYRILPDGRRSDEMLEEEREYTLNERYIKTFKLTTNREPASAEEAARYLNNARQLKYYELFFRGADAIRKAYRDATGQDLNGTDSEILDAIEVLGSNYFEDIGLSDYTPTAVELERALSNLPPVEWHIYETPPEGLTQYDLLSVYVERYKGDAKGSFTDLKKDYPALYDALTAYIKNTIPQARGLKANQLYKEFISWGELEKLGVIGYESVTTPDKADIIMQFTEENTTENYTKRHRLAFNGIAILKDPHSDQVDENGNYIEHNDPLADFDSLDSVAEDADKIAEIEDCQELIDLALSYFYAFNTLMGIIGAVYDIPDLGEVARHDTAPLEQKMDAFNSELYKFYFTIYAFGEERKRKREQIKAIFTPLESDELKPRQEAIDAVTAKLSNLGYTETARSKLIILDYFIAQLIGGLEII